MNKFWNWKKHRITNQDGTESTERVLELRGTIAEESWYADDVTPKMFKDELLSGSGDITVYISCRNIPARSLSKLTLSQHLRQALSLWQEIPF